jgi:hypothetical protein
VACSIIRHRAIFPGLDGPSIVTAARLNCRVRHGNGCFPRAMDTDLAFVPRSLPSKHSLAGRQRSWPIAVSVTLGLSVSVQKYASFDVSLPPSAWLKYKSQINFGTGNLIGVYVDDCVVNVARVSYRCKSMLSNTTRRMYCVQAIGHQRPVKCLSTLRWIL